MHRIDILDAHGTTHVKRYNCHTEEVSVLPGVHPNLFLDMALDPSTALPESALVTTGGDRLLWFTLDVEPRELVPIIRESLPRCVSERLPPPLWTLVAAYCVPNWAHGRSVLPLGTQWITSIAPTPSGHLLAVAVARRGAPASRSFLSCIPSLAWDIPDHIDLDPHVPSRVRIDDSYVYFAARSQSVPQNSDIFRFRLPSRLARPAKFLN